VLIDTLLNTYERRAARISPESVSPHPPRAIKLALNEVKLPGYESQMDPEPRQVANEQLLQMEKAGCVRLFWQPGERGHLLEAVALLPGGEPYLYTLAGRIPVASLRTRLESLLLGDRFRLAEQDWRRRAIENVLAQLKKNQSPAPFCLDDPAYNEDLLTGLLALTQIDEETPFRVFSVKAFNDSKRFESLKNAFVRLARVGRPEWKRLPEAELLRELNLVANPTYLLLSGSWALVDTDGQVLSLGSFQPSVGVPAVQAMHLERVSVHAETVVCIENFTTFHSLAGSLTNLAGAPSVALLCLGGNPSPACRKLLACLARSEPKDRPIWVWADLDFGGFNILSQLRRQIDGNFRPYRMDVDTLERFAQFARPLTPNDRRNLERQANRLELADVRPVIDHLMKRGLKLEQEAIALPLAEEAAEGIPH
jgi:hypothetical protein